MGLVERHPRVQSRVGRAEAARHIDALPPYQVALWPDGWEHLTGGGILVRDTDAMAEARRWYALADRNRGAVPMERAMGLHGSFVPRAVVALSRQRFASEEAASVAVQLVAGSWIRQRRAHMLGAPARTLQERDLAWSGSRNAETGSAAAVESVLRRLLALCATERLIPNALYQMRVQREEGFGVSGFRCTVEVWLESYACRRLEDVLATALVPWNRALVRDGNLRPLIGIRVRRPAAAGIRAGPGRSPAG